MSDPFSENEDLFGGLFEGLGFFQTPPTPDTVPLRILGLDRLPRTKKGLADAFRKRVMDTHPDRDPFNNVADRAAVAQTAEFIEIVWARDTLKLRVKELAATTDTTRNDEPRVCEACGLPFQRMIKQQGVFGFLGTEPHPHPDPGCKECGGKRETPNRRDWRDKRGGLHTDRRDELAAYGRWEGYCYWCQDDAHREALRQKRLAVRTDLTCNGCGGTFTPKRADGKYCSPACRQKAYRHRKSES